MSRIGFARQTEYQPYQRGLMQQRVALAVDDEDDILYIYRRVLSKTGFEVLEARDGAQAIEILANHTPDVIFLDMLLPKVNGQAVLEYIRDHPRLHAMRVVVISAHQGFAADDRWFDEFMLKPVRPTQIEEAARRALEEITQQPPDDPD